MRTCGDYVVEDIAGTMSPAGLSRVKLFSPRISHRCSERVQTMSSKVEGPPQPKPFL